MPGTLYLDTARLGQMSPSARNANLDFVRLTAEEPSSLYFENFLRDGNDAWPSAYRRRFPGLNCWQGVSELKQAIAGVLRLSGDYRVMLANRSAQLMSFAARILFRLCCNVMTTDTSWPSYRLLLESEAAETSKSVSTLPLRENVFEDAISADEVATLFADEYAARGCDGLFLPAVDNLGVRLPVEQIVARIKRQNEVRFIVVDGAQALCHVDNSTCTEVCDLFITGCHKWLRAYNPMGLAVAGRRRSRDFIEHTLSTMLSSLDVDDPLLRFSEQIETDRTHGYSETVNIAPLFSCRGALHDALETEPPLDSLLQIRKQNADLIADASAGTGWHVVRPSNELQTGILLLRSRCFDQGPGTVEHLRGVFHHRGIVLTAYEDGLIRLSMPGRRFDFEELSQIRHALACVNLSPRHVSTTAFVA